LNGREVGVSRPGPDGRDNYWRSVFVPDVSHRKLNDEVIIEKRRGRAVTLIQVIVQANALLNR
jgi:hypothetical protein